MTGTRRFPVVLRKEVRAIAPGWLACLALSAAAALVVRGWSRQLSIVVYSVGPIALGSFSIGHEYSGRTL